MNRLIAHRHLPLALLLVVATDAGAQARLQQIPSSTRPREGVGSGVTPGIVSDPSFEAGTPNPFWTEFSQTFGTPLCTTNLCGDGGGTGPRTGQWWAWFGGTTAAESAFMEQSVTLPAGTADLVFWLEIPDAGIPGEMRVMMGGTTIGTYSQADTSTYATYEQVTLDIDAFAGGTHILRFEASNPAGPGVINFFVDDVQINAVPSGPNLHVSPPSINFGPVQTGTSSSPEVVTLTNNGTAGVTIASITPSGAGYSVNTSGTDLTLDPTQSTTFTVTFSPLVVGSAPGTVAIASNSAGSPHTVALSGQGTNYTTYPSTSGPIAIPDGNPVGITSSIVVPAGAPSIGDLDVALEVTHSWVGDVVVSLSKAATSSTIFNRPGVSTNPPFGCSGNNIDIIVDDQGSDGTIGTSCTSGTPAYPVSGGRYIPDPPDNDPLSPFTGQSATGTWTLTVSDPAPDETGTLDSWALLVTPPPVADEGGPAAGVMAMSIQPNPLSASGQIQLSVATTQDVRVSLFDVLGREVAVIFEGSVASTQVAYIALPTRRLAPGAYVIRASGEDFATTQRVTITR